MSATNGMNGFGSGRRSSMSGGEILQWKLGLINNGKYLTAETFGFKINVSAITMRKKQIWTLEHDPEQEDVVYIKSHQNRYISGDKKGVATCDCETSGDSEKFHIEYSQDGKWAFRNVATGYYFGGSEDMLRCYEKAPTATEWWTPQLAVHPQVNVRSVARKRYAHLHEDAIYVDELTPWGSDALITLEYSDGQYAVKTCDARYLHQEGHLVPTITVQSKYTLEIKSGIYSGMALKDNRGHYLTAVDKTGTMKTREKFNKKDIVFTLEDSHPQVFITAHNGKKVSIKQGVDVTANQDEVDDTETFQIEFDKIVKKWRVRTSSNAYWSLEAAAGIQGVGSDSTPNGLFELEYQDDGRVAIKANNGNYVGATLIGSLNASKPGAASDKELFTLTIMNRPILVLRCEYGFIGYRSSSKPLIECNRTNYDFIHVDHAGGEASHYYLKGANGKYWALDSGANINADSSEPAPFYFELTSQSKFAIKAPNGSYLKGEQNGIVSASCDKSRATQWEY